MSGSINKRSHRQASGPSANGGKFLTFFLGDAKYAFEIMKVQEIIGMIPIEPVPKMPHYISGLMELRGKVIPVLSLRSRFGLEEIEETDDTCLLVIKQDKCLLGVLVDKALDIVAIETSEIENTPGPDFEGFEGCIAGVSRVNNNRIIILDVEILIEDIPRHVFEVTMETI